MKEKRKFEALFTDLHRPYLVEVEGRELKEGEVLVKVEAAPINPSDKFVARGEFDVDKTFKDPPYGLGFEG
jgi:NADPH:quinone reductase-like Zn-dependent oxidoreductase